MKKFLTSFLTFFNRFNYSPAFKGAGSTVIILSFLILLKTVFQIIVIKSGFKWLSADDYCRTVISYDWLQNPKIYSGVWLSLHFWLNGLFILIFKNLFLSALVVNTLFSVLTLVYFYLLIKKIFKPSIAVISCLIFSVFPFQVWLSSSGLPESVFFFFIIAACYYLIKWFTIFKSNKNFQKAAISLGLSSLFLNIANLLRYEGWIFSLTFFILILIISYRHLKLQWIVLVYSSIGFSALLSIFWWLYMNNADHHDPFYFAKETTRIFSDLNQAGLWQRIIQYPSFMFYIAPLTTVLGLRKIYLVIINRRNGFSGNFSLVRIFLAFNAAQLLLLMLSGVLGSGGTNMISRYVVINALLLIPFAVWQILDLKKYIASSIVLGLLFINILWSFYYPHAYRDDTYEVAELTKKLADKDYFEDGDKIYFEPTEGYYDIYPLQVISNNPDRFIMDTIPAYFPPNVPLKKISKKKQEEERQRLGILEVRKFLEEKKVKLCIVKNELLIDKLRKLSYKSEQIGDYYIFYLAENKIKLPKQPPATLSVKSGRPFDNDIISFDKKLVLKDFRIDNTNLGLNPQTITLIWQIADPSILDSLFTDEDQFGRYSIKISLTETSSDSSAYEVYSRIFSERIIEEFFDSEEIKNIMIIKPFALLNYSIKPKPAPFESGIYNILLSVKDEVQKKELPVFKGDSIFIYKSAESDTLKDSTTEAKQTSKNIKEKKVMKTAYPLGRLIAMFPNADYNQVIKRSKDLPQIILRNGFMILFSQRYQGDQFLNWVFNYF